MTEFIKNAISSAIKAGTYVYERDIDLLMLEEFRSNEDFQHWFADQITTQIADLAPTNNLNFLKAAHSVSETDGESDLLVSYTDTTGNLILLMIENKVNAQFQPKQAERYRLRGDKYILQGEFAKYHTVLVAPNSYFGNATALHGFDARVTYEALQAWFLQNKILGLRGLHKASLLEAAINKPSGGNYQFTPDEIVTNFWRSYWRLTLEVDPELNMPDPGLRAKDGTFIPFPLPGNPKRVSLLHKFNHGNVDLQFNDFAKNLVQLRTKYQDALDPQMLIVSAGKSGVIRLTVPRMDAHLPFEEQIEKACLGIQAALKLGNLYKNVDDEV